MFPFGFKFGRMFGKGDFRYVVLKALSERPMHGYEIMKVIGERFSGFYAPSPGVVYPTLQMLEDDGHIKARKEKGKKIYQITKSGRAFLRSHRDLAEAGAKRMEEFLDPDKMALFHELRKTARLLFMSHEDLTPEQTRKIAAMIKEMRHKITETLE